MPARIITAPLFDDDRPHLSYGPNWIAYYDGLRPVGQHGSGNTEAQAIADLIAKHPRDHGQCECAA